MKNVLMLSIDQSILREESEAALRMKSYGKIASELHIVVFTEKIFSDAYTRLQISPNVFAYPTNTRWKFLYLFDFYAIAKRILGSDAKNWLITSQDAFTHLGAIILKWRFTIPLEIQIHTDFLSPYFRTESFKNYIRYFFYCFAVLHADSIRVVSERIRESLVHKSHNNQNADIYVLPVFVDSKKIQESSISADLHKKYSNYDFIFLMASRLTKEKNIALALDAFSAIAKVYPKSLLLIVGSGPEKENILLKIAALELENNVIVEPIVSQEVLISYYKTADIFLLTSDYEGYGRTSVEALSAGLPVISTDVGVAGDFLIHGITGAVVGVRDTENCKETMFDSIQNYAQFEEYAKKGQALILKKGMSEEQYYVALQRAWERK